MAPRVFLLSPANCAGLRMSFLLRKNGASDTAKRLRSADGATLGEVFQFASALYFRGKLAYARAFARPPEGFAGDLVITPGLGLVSGATPIGLSDLKAIAKVRVDPASKKFRKPLERDAAALAAALGGSGEAVLLGSVASQKYTAILLDALGERLLFPPSFVGRGDLSRGGLLLRTTRAGEELDYAPVAGAVTRGRRAARLPKLPRRITPPA